MIGTQRGTVLAVGARRPGATELTVALDRGEDVAALAYPLLVGEPRAGDRVVVSTGALDAGLGTGGLAFVVVVEGRSGAAPAGRLVKARYTPQQVLVAEPGDPGVDDLAGMPVVVADLHSALPAVLAGVRATRPGLRTVLVLDDAAALPLWVSRSIPVLAESGWLAGTVTAGQAYGGQLEAVSRYDALLAARGRLGADLVVVCPGPGGVGTNTRWGFSGVAAGESVNAAGVLGGRPVASLRLSQADPRPRHRPVSHHSVTAYGRVALLPADLPVPAGHDEVRQAVLDSGMLAGRHRIVEVDVAGLEAALRTAPVPLSTMGRGLAQDLLAFLGAAAAGRHAAAMIGP